MLRSFALALGFSAVLAVLAHAAHHEGEPSSGAKGMPGAKGTFEFKPADWMEGVLERPLTDPHDLCAAQRDASLTTALQRLGLDSSPAAVASLTRDLAPAQTERTSR